MALKLRASTLELSHNSGHQITNQTHHHNTRNSHSMTWSSGNAGSRYMTSNVPCVGYRSTATVRTFVLSLSGRQAARCPGGHNACAEQRNVALPHRVSTLPSSAEAQCSTTTVQPQPHLRASAASLVTAYWPPCLLRFLLPFSPHSGQ
jgi:hypothetical protein